jgi:hypothetical protein
MPRKPTTLHLYAQDQAHDPAQIVRDVGALKKLRDQIDEAIEQGVSVSDPEEFSQNDGRGFHLAVAIVNPEDARNLSSAYSGEFVMPGGESVNPAELTGQK